jgi:hypothetical protein
MIAITTSSSMSVKAGEEERCGEAMDADLSAGPGERNFGPPARGPLQTVCERPARMLVAEASEQKLDGQVFWLTARVSPRTAFPPRGSGLLPGDLADYSGGPATDSHRLPYSPRSGFPAEAPVEDGY